MVKVGLELNASCVILDYLVAKYNISADDLHEFVDKFTSAMDDSELYVVRFEKGE